MQIIWYGQNCFKIISPEVTILTDPFSPQKVGLKNPKIGNEGIIIFSSVEEKKITPPNNFVVFTPGEYEIKNVLIYGLPHFEGKELKTIYQLDIEEIKVCFLGEISQKPKDEELEKLGKINILILPVSGKKTISPQEAAEVVNEIQPNLIIPSGWQDEKELLPFIKKTGIKKEAIVDKLKIKKKDFSDEKIRFFILRPLGSKANE